MSFAGAAYSADPWQGFFTAQVGAAAALTGLLFVAVSINLEKILQFPKLPARAGETLALLLLVLVVASLGLIPQSETLLGTETALCAALVGVVTLSVQLRHGPDNPTDPTWWFVSRIANIQIPTLFMLVGGISLVAGGGGGLYWTAAGALTAFLSAVYNAWVLLVEIIRQHPTPAVSVPAETASPAHTGTEVQINHPQLAKTTERSPT